MTISLPLVLWLLVLHYVGDSLLQSGRVAVEKGKCLYTLTYHVAIYGICLSLGLIGYLDPNPISLGLFIGANSIFHWLTDLITSRLNSRLWAAGTATTPPNLHWFFVSVLGDQLVHTSTLILTGYWLLS